MFQYSCFLFFYYFVLTHGNNYVTISENFWLISSSSWRLNLPTVLLITRANQRLPVSVISSDVNGMFQKYTYTLNSKVLPTEFVKAMKPISTSCMRIKLNLRTRWFGCGSGAWGCYLRNCNVFIRQMVHSVIMWTWNYIYKLL